AGFGVRLRRSGARTWHFQYAVCGRTKRMSLGKVSEIEPGKALATARTLKARVRLGEDPAVLKIEGRAAAAMTFGSLLPDYLERKRASSRGRGYVEVERHLLRYVRPLHSRPVAAINNRAIAVLLGEIAKKHGPAAANRCRGSLSAYFNYLAKEGITDGNPV